MDPKLSEGIMPPGERRPPRAPVPPGPGALIPERADADECAAPRELKPT
jgi:hypothetical protein